MTTKHPHVKVGVAPSATENNSSLFMTMVADEILECKILVNADEIVSVEQCALWNVFNPSPVWVYIGSEDPSHDLGVRPGYRAFLPISFTKDGEKLVRLWSMSKTSHRRISEISEMAGPLKGQIVKIKRTGTGLKTEHSIINVGRRVKISETVPTVEEIINLLGPYTRAEIISSIEIATELEFSEVIEKVAAATPEASPKSGKKSPKASTKAPKKKVEVVELTEDDDEEFEEVEDEVVEDDSDEDEIEEMDEEEEDIV